MKARGGAGEEGWEEEEEEVRERNRSGEEANCWLRRWWWWGKQEAGGNPNVCFVFQAESRKHRSICSQTDVIAAKNNKTLRLNGGDVWELDYVYRCRNVPALRLASRWTWPPAVLCYFCSSQRKTTNCWLSLREMLRHCCETSWELIQSSGGGLKQVVEGSFRSVTEVEGLTSNCKNTTLKEKK